MNWSAYAQHIEWQPAVLDVSSVAFQVGIMNMIIHIFDKIFVIAQSFSGSFK